MQDFRVTVFCASGPNGPRKDEFLDLAERFGAMLAREGFACANGGAHGMMTALCRGAYQNGGHVTGIMLDPKRFAPDHDLRHTTEEFEKLFLRQARLLEIGDAYVALPGGTGTLYEVAQVVAMKSIGEIPVERPMVCVGKTWEYLKAHLHQMKADGLSFCDPFELVTFVDTPEEAIAILKTYRETQKSNHPDV